MLIKLALWNLSHENVSLFETKEVASGVIEGGGRVAIGSAG